jgi:polyisoprenoid-binding protein YceI
MNKTILSTVAVAAIIAMSACSNNGTKVETQDAQKVSVNTGDQAATYANLREVSMLDWRASHLAGAQPRFGKIYLESAKVLVEKNLVVNATVVMNMNSFTVENFPEGDENIEKLRGHLMSADFFDVENNPTSKFEVTKVENTTGDYSSIVTGNLTIMGVTKSINFKANISISDEMVSIKSEDFAINRADWNLTYNAEGTEGVPVDYLIANDIGFTIDVTVGK